MNQRFIKAYIPEAQLDRCYVLSDYRFWAAHEEEFNTWLEYNTVKGRNTQTGMVLMFANEQEELLFHLKWGG